MEEILITAIYTFLLGTIGSATFLFLYLLIQGDLGNLQNNVISSKAIMSILYILTGGTVTTIWSLSTIGTLTLTELFQVFMIGIGWQGMITGLINAKNARSGKDVNEALTFAKEQEQKIRIVEDEKLKDLAGDI